MIVGKEPSVHYWLNLAHVLKEIKIKFVFVNLLHVKRSKELDESPPTKNDVKDESLNNRLRLVDPLILRFHKKFMQNSGW